ncbi:MAG: hypothetical protein Ct9H90mP16_20690 [Candidatus Poseidoniales archaeon]|nr:MAG: hypothetical protein Ct9H90mP16_20690 [Candidatus Poseidoniales archaeon]
MRLTLQNPLEFTNREDLISTLDLDPDGPPIYLYSLGGSPCDCTIVAITHGFENWAPMVRLNYASRDQPGPNISIDVIHSGTVSGAREAALYGPFPGPCTEPWDLCHEDIQSVHRSYLS